MLQMVKVDNVTGCSTAGNLPILGSITDPTHQQTALSLQVKSYNGHLTHPMDQPTFRGNAYGSQTMGSDFLWSWGKTGLRNKESQSAYAKFSCPMQVSIQLPSLILVNTHTPRLEGPLQTGK
jgi:hypothetical protein